MQSISARYGNTPEKLNQKFAFLLFLKLLHIAFLNFQPIYVYYKFNSSEINVI